MGEAEKVERMGPIGVVRALSSALIERARWATQAGLSFGGTRDLYAALGYKRELTTEDYRSMYARNGVAQRVVEALPKATWRGNAELIEDEDPDTETKFEKAFYCLNDSLNIWSMFYRADVLAGLGRYSVLVLGGPGEMDQPLESMTPEEFRYLTPYGEHDAKISTWETDTKSERFGLPVLYQIGRFSPGGGISRPVHHSRVIHIADGLLDDHVYGKPRLEGVMNFLVDLEKVAGGGAEAFWKRADQGMQLDIDPEIKFTPEQKQALADEVEEYVHGLKRIVRTRGVTMNTLGSDVANFGAPVDSIIALISTSMGIPQRILMGSERGELASTQDKTNWDDRVSDRRREYAEAIIVKPFICRLIALGTLPEPKDWYARWPEIDNLPENVRSTMAVQLAGLNTAAGDIIVMPDEIRDRVLKWPPLTEEQKKEAQAMKDEQAAQQQAQMEAEVQAKADAGLVEAPNPAAPAGPPAKKGPPVNLREQGRAKAKEQREFASKGLVAAIRSAVAHGQTVLRYKTLDDAIAAGDTETVRLLLAQAHDKVERDLRRAVREEL